MRLEPTHETKVNLARLFKPTAAAAKAVGFKLVQQVRQRFKTGGKSGGIIWPEKRVKTWGADDHRDVLMGTGHHFMDSFEASYPSLTDDGFVVEVSSSVSWAKVHQFGTQGRGGPLPTIRPKKAKALFIPISERAKVTSRHEGQEAAHIRSAYGRKPTMGPLRQATRKHGKEMVGQYFAELKAGKLEKGRLYKRGRPSKKFPKGKWVLGKPDFIFLSKVDIPARPMLPDGTAERAEQIETVLEVLTA